MSACHFALPIGLVGYGISNKSVEKYLLNRGVSGSEIFVFEDSKAGPTGEEFLRSSECKSLCVSPGYPLATPWLELARQQGVTIEGEISLASKALNSVRDQMHFIGVTGSAGKSTVVSLLAAGLGAGGRSCFLGGNIGRPLMDLAMEFSNKDAQIPEFVVLELSSYQLENAGELQLDTALITSLSPNHLDRYRDLKSYYDTKLNLFRITKGKKWASFRSAGLRSFFQQSGVANTFDLNIVGEQSSSEESQLKKLTDSPLSSLDFSQMKMLGDQNVDNVKMTAALLHDLGVWNDEVKQALLDFPGLPHRTEMITGKLDTVFVNDSKSTTMESVLQSVESVYGEKQKRAQTSAKMFVLIGGRDKGHDWSQLSVLSKFSNMEFVFFGESAELAKEGSGLSGKLTTTFQGCCEFLSDHVAPGDWVLLSPGGSSWDEFANFEERGNFFREYAERQWG